jgi:tetratricopeptide (TPR) repeat protein
VLPTAPGSTTLMRRRASQLVALLFAAALAAGPCNVAAQPALEDLLARAAEMSAAGKHAEAYALLSAEEDLHIGEIAYDYALGRAALHAGRPDRATIAFSRVVALDPGHAGARIDMGRAFLALGNRAQAEAAFEALLALDPPPALRAQLLAFVAEARAERQRGPVARAFLSVSAGTSSNVNQAPGQGQIFVPGLLAVLQLADQNVGKDDSFASVGGGVEAAMPLRGRFSLIGGAELLSRVNAHESDFDVGGVVASLGFGWAGERRIARVLAQAVRNTLGGTTSREVSALSVDVMETSAAPGTAGAMFAFAHLGSYRHPPEELKIFDADFLTLGAGWVSRLDRDSTLSVAFLAGGDNDRGGNVNGDRLGMGLRVAWESVLAPKLKVSTLVSGQNSRYEGFDAVFLASREDRRTDLEGFLQYQLAPKLEARFGVWRSVQVSNIPIYEYRRTDWYLMLRRQFD